MNEELYIVTICVDDDEICSVSKPIKKEDLKNKIDVAVNDLFKFNRVSFNFKIDATRL